MEKNLITVRNYAVKNNVTTQCVYTQMKKGRLKFKEIDGVKFIVVK
jgi:hypothetical protein